MTVALDFNGVLGPIDSSRVGGAGHTPVPSYIFAIEATGELRENDEDRFASSLEEGRAVLSTRRRTTTQRLSKEGPPRDALKIAVGG